MKRYVRNVLGAAALTTLSTTSFAGQDPCDGNIVDVAVANGFNTLVAAVDQAGLVDVLQGPGPFTVFAPTDEAFAAIPPVVADFLFANPQILADVLLYHVVAGAEVPADVAETLPGAQTALGQRLAISTSGDDLFINDSEVILEDVPACNGIVHVIDQVLVPDLLQSAGLARAVAAQLDIVDALTLYNFATGEFSSLLESVIDADLVGDLKGLSDVTLFAPTDEAFANLPMSVVMALQADPDLIVDVLLYHAVPEVLFASDVIGQSGATTLLGQDLDFMFDGTNVFVDESQVVLPNLRVSNGVFHIIDSVLIPE